MAPQGGVPGSFRMVTPPSLENAEEGGFAFACEEPFTND